MFGTSTLNVNSILNKFAAVAWSQFSFFDEQTWTDVSSNMKLMKSVKIKINRLKERVCHQFLPIDQYNRYQSNPIYRFLSIYGFLSIDYSGSIVNISRWLRKQREHGLLRLYRNSADETAAGRAAENFPVPRSMTLFANWQLCIYYSGWYSE